MRSPTTRAIVIVGGGLAGLRACERLRELGYSGPVTMVGEETRPAYNRPPLSKQVLEHRMHPDDLRLNSFVDLDIEPRYGVRAERLEPLSRHVVLSDGERLAYDGLIIATGVSPRRLPDAPNNDERVRVLRTINDATSLDRLLRRARRLLIVGGGFVGCEVAATARHRAIPVTIVDPAPNLLGRVVGPALGALIAELHTEAGVDLRLGRSIKQWRTASHAVTAHLDDGSEIAADVVLVAVGTAPRVEWLADLGLDLSNGVLCDATCHVAGLDDVVAAGDVARWPNPRFGEEARRVEHWINAIEHGQAAAESLLEGREAAKPFAPLPRFWSEQYGLRVQAVGMPAIAERVALAEGSIEQRQLVTVHLRGEQPVGAIGIDSPRAMLRYAAIVDEATALESAAPAQSAALLTPPAVQEPRPRSPEVVFEPARPVRELGTSVVPRLLPATVPLLSPRLWSQHATATRGTD
jgi:NADPH-dependent 2,4-dienoyl-CoA reductase/sulfur reductase-like enzyme